MKHNFALLHDVIQEFEPSLTMEKVITGDIDLEDHKTFLIVCVLALSTEYYWDRRHKQSPLSQSSIYGIIKAYIEILSQVPKLSNFYITVVNVTKNAFNS